MRFIAFALAYFSVFLSVYILTAASSFFIPLAIALITSYLIIAVTEGFGSLKIFGKKISKLLAFSAAMITLSLAFLIIFSIVQKNVSELIERAPLYQEHIQLMMDKWAKIFHIDLKDVSSYLNHFDLGEIFKEVLFTLTQIAGNAGIIFVYILFIMVEYIYYDEKLKALFPDASHLRKARSITHKIVSQIKSYLKIKTFISLFTAVLVYVVLKIVGVDFAEFWALLVFFLNFIPTIGSIISTSFPCVVALVQFESLLPFIIVTSILVFIQFVVGNIVEPRIMGSQFNLSGLVILISLIVWGKMWGVIGMFLCVPLLMIISIVLANFPHTRSVAVLLSQNGKID